MYSAICPSCHRREDISFGDRDTACYAENHVAEAVSVSFFYIYICLRGKLPHSRISGRNDIHMIAPVESIAAVRVYGSLESWLGLGVRKNLLWGAFT